ncbi:hypothetical protein BT96DRAFT_1010535 [Gymnopus androsaceus JB14]|uniref:Uncharacterized protein n=1 Tax=Gymnopus androsaceus JB14 TaxID=1447944 RepID=A0A6A4GAR3_9AGAR|nr:hypothetical protein BT96DRAFT_1010535 [Gymnopus androsaceus JB14]
MEAIWAALAFHGAFPDFEKLMSQEGQALQPCPLYYLYLAFKFHLEYGLSEFKGSKHGQAEPLTQIRDNFRKTLLRIGAVNGEIGSMQDSIGWLDFIVKSRSLPVNEDGVQFFTMQTQDVQICLEKDKNLHFQTCWRKVYIEDYISEKESCSGKCIETHFICNIPVIWTIRPDIADGKYWDFPLQLFPLSKEEAQKHGVVYDLVARIYSSDDHFITSTIIPTTQRTQAVFVYNGVCHNGYSQIMPGNVSELMAGKFPKCKAGYHPHAAIYKLKGGLGAQMRFKQVLQAKSKALTEINLQPDLTGTLDSSKWTAHVEHNGRSHDYNLMPEYDFATTKLGAIIKKQISRSLKAADTKEDLKALTK